MFGLDVIESTLVSACGGAAIGLTKQHRRQVKVTEIVDEKGNRTRTVHGSEPRESDGWFKIVVGGVVAWYAIPVIIGGVVIAGAFVTLANLDTPRR